MFKKGYTLKGDTQKTKIKLLEVKITSEMKTYTANEINNRLQIQLCKIKKKIVNLKTRQNRNLVK